jgi:hypothetical protein
MRVKARPTVSLLVYGLILFVNAAALLKRGGSFLSLMLGSLPFADDRDIFALSISRYVDVDAWTIPLTIAV